MPHRVAEQVGHELARQRLVARVRHIRRDVADDGDVPRIGQHLAAAHALGDDLIEVEIGGDDLALPGIDAREQEHVLHQSGQTARLLADDAEGLAVLGLGARIAAQRHVGGRAHDRHRRSQLVRRVGHEAALLVDRVVEPVDQIVEGAGQRAHLVVWIDDRQPLRIGRGNRRGFVDHPANRSQRAGGGDRAAERGEQQRQWHGHDDGAAQHQAFVNHVVERRGDRDAIRTTGDHDFADAQPRVPSG